MAQHSDQADFNVLVSTIGAIVSVTTIQPIITMIAGLVAIVSGIMAIRYYYNATKKVKND
jgi:hypothetical protein